MSHDSAKELRYGAVTESAAPAIETKPFEVNSLGQYYKIPTITYKYNEAQLLQEITEYVNSTYGAHYSQAKIQTSEFIIDSGHGVGFTIGNIMKYAQRYGKKGSPEDWRKDLLKVIHYGIMALHVHDLGHKRESQHPNIA